MSITNDNEMKLTPEVYMTDEIIYLIRIDGEEAFVVRNEKEAKLAIDSIAASEEKSLSDEKTSVYRQDSNDGNSVTISTRTMGRFFNGPMKLYTKIDYVPVGFAKVKKGRLELSIRHPKMITIPTIPEKL